MSDNSQQAWLARAYEALRKRYLPNAPGRDKVVVSYGFPKGRSGRGKRIGECWSKPTPDGTAAVIFVHPCQWTGAVDVLHVLLHEQIHALHPDAGHKGAFVQECKRVGLEGKPTSTHPGEALRADLEKLAKAVGEFPAAAFDYSAGKKQTTRMRKYTCPCDVIVRTASDDFNATCNECGEEFTRSEGKKGKE